MKIYIKTGRALARARVSTGLTAVGFARILDVSQSFLTNMELGNKPIPAGVLERLIAWAGNNGLDVSEVVTEYTAQKIQSAVLDDERVDDLVALATLDVHTDDYIQVRSILEKHKNGR